MEQFLAILWCACIFSILFATGMVIVRNYGRDRYALFMGMLCIVFGLSAGVIGILLARYSVVLN